MRDFLIGFFFCFKQKTADELRMSDWSSDVCSSDLARAFSQRGSDGGDGPEQDQRIVLRRQEAPPLPEAGRPSSMALTIRASAPPITGARGPGRSAERRVEKECVSTCRSRR